jgi:hypothetical protein
MMSNVLRRSVRAWRNIAGENSTFEQVIRHQVGKITSRIEKNYSGKDYVIFWEGDKEASKTGIFMNGGCDMPAIFTAVPAIREVLNGTVCIRKHGAVANSHTNLLLQSRQPLPAEWLQPVSEKLKLAPDYFTPRLFETEFTVHSQNGPETFQKNVVIFSIGPDIIRTLYRHNEHGFLIDPGGYWLSRSMEEILADMSSTMWFNSNFSKTKLIDVETFATNLEKVVNHIHQEMDATILILNVLTVEPGDMTHNFQFQKNPYELRRREFCYALANLSRKLDFYIVDVDRTLKRAGLRDTQMDFAHYPDEVYPYIGQEVFRILQDLGGFFE